METATDSIKAAVEAKCLCALLPNRVDLEPCTPCDTMPVGECVATCACQGTGLKHPSLSRECPGRRYIDMSGEHKISHSVPIRGRRCRCAIISNGSGRISDVDLEKVMDLLGASWVHIAFHHPFDDWWIELPLLDPHKTFTGDTPLLAACAALVESQEIPKPETP